MKKLDPIALLERLVSFPSVSFAANGELVDFIANLFSPSRARMARIASPDGDRESLVIELGPEVDPETPDGLVLSGHLDVVPADEARWSSDPFSLRHDDDRLFARGSADMKGFIAVALGLALDAAQRELSAPLVLVLTRDEEVGTLGAKQLAEEWRRPLPKNAVIGEPTSLRPVRMHKGHLRLVISLRGKAAHSAYPHLGKSAISAAAKAVTALDALAADLAGERTETSRYFPSVPFVPLNVGTIRGGRAVNIVPADCYLELGVRPMPGTSASNLVDRIQETLRCALPADSYECALADESPPLLSAEDTPIRRHVCHLMASEDDEGVSYATDAGWLQRLGLDCLVWGPGSIEQAHRPDEFISRSQLALAEEKIGELVRVVCF